MDRVGGDALDVLVEPAPDGLVDEQRLGLVVRRLVNTGGEDHPSGHVRMQRLRGRHDGSDPVLVVVPAVDGQRRHGAGSQLGQEVQHRVGGQLGARLREVLRQNRCQQRIGRWQLPGGADGPLGVEPLASGNVVFQRVEQRHGGRDRAEPREVGDARSADRHRLAGVGGAPVAVARAARDAGHRQPRAIEQVRVDRLHQRERLGGVQEVLVGGLAAIVGVHQVAALGEVARARAQPGHLAILPRAVERADDRPSARRRGVVGTVDVEPGGGPVRERHHLVGDQLDPESPGRNRRILGSGVRGHQEATCERGKEPAGRRVRRRHGWCSSRIRSCFPRGRQRDRASQAKNSRAPKQASVGRDRLVERASRHLVHQRLDLAPPLRSRLGDVDQPAGCVGQEHDAELRNQDVARVGTTSRCLVASRSSAFHRAFGLRSPKALLRGRARGDAMAAPGRYG